MVDFLKIFWALYSERACCSSSYIWDISWYHFMCKLLLLHRSRFSIYSHFLAISVLCIDCKALFKEVVQDLLWCKHLIYCHGSTRSYTHVCHLCPTVMHYMLCCHLQLLPNWLLGKTFAATSVPGCQKNWRYFATFYLFFLSNLYVWCWSLILDQWA